MSKRADFQRGEAVAHISLGDGVVIENGCDTLSVKFDRKSDDGAYLFGAYDDNWFRLHPRYLFHRGAAPGERDSIADMLPSDTGPRF